MRLEFEKQLELIGAEKSLDERRKMALKLAPLLQQYQTTYLEIGRSQRAVDEDVLGVRAELIWQEMMEEVGAAAEWPRNGGEFWIRMGEAVPSPHSDEVGLMSTDIDRAALLEQIATGIVGAHHRE